MLYDFHVDLRLDSSHTLYFKVPTTDPKVALPVEDAELDWGGDVFYITEVDRVREGSTTYVSVTAAALWLRLGENQVPGTVSLSALTPAQGVDVILSHTVIGTGAWKRGAATTASAVTYSADYTDQTVLAMLRDWAAVTGTYVTFTTAERKVDLAVTRGYDRGVPFWYRRNVLSISRRSTAPTCTVLYPYGKDDLSIAGLNGTPYVEDFSWYTARGMTLVEARARFTKRKVLPATNIVDDVALLGLAQRTLASLSQGEVHYEAKVVDLTGQTDLPVSDLLALRPGDICGVKDEVLGWNVSTTLVRMDVYPNDPSRNVVELATLPETAPNLGSASRDNNNTGRILFQSGSAALALRGAPTWITNRIPVRFQAGGDAAYGVSIRAVGVGTGSMSVSAVDNTSGLLVRPIITIPFTNGQVVRTTETWSADKLSGPYDYRLRVAVTGAGGVPDNAVGVNIAVADMWFWILALGAVRETPTALNSATFNYTGVNQFWTAPDNITEAMFTVAGGAAGASTAGSGNGSRIAARFNVIAGAMYRIVVGNIGGRAGYDGYHGSGGWPNGGDASFNGVSDSGAGGGGASWVVLESAPAFTNALLVAPGGGGGAESTGGAGGAAGFFFGADGQPGPGQTTEYGRGATQSAPGAGGTPGGEAGDVDGLGYGGDALAGGGYLTYNGGGGGGGWHGGGGAGYSGGINGRQSGGGGGSGYVSPAAADVQIEDAIVSGAGQIVITWDLPLT